jgi:uncharacterized membrane protein YtjA (UPF0391 family)
MNWTVTRQTLSSLRLSIKAANPTKEIAMLHYAVVFFVIALIAALFGFGGIAASAVGIAKILFVVFAILAVASFLFGIIKK